MATEVKPKSNRILLIFGVFLAIVAFAGALLVGRTSGGNGNVIGTGKTVDVVVAMQEIAPTTQITAQLVQVSKVSEEAVAPYAFKDKNLVIGKYAAIQIHKDAQIIDTDLVTDVGNVQPTKQAYLPLDKGLVAMQIPTGELVGVGGYIQPDDRIDIIATLTPPRSTKSETVTTFTNLRILRVGPAGGANTRGISSSLTVVVTLQQAQELKWLLDNTNYKYVLKFVGDYGQPDAPTSQTDAESFASNYHVR